MPVLFRIQLSIAYAASCASAGLFEDLGRKLEALTSIPEVQFGDKRTHEYSKEDHCFQAVLYVPKEHEFIAQHVCWEAIKDGWTVTLYSN